MAGNQNPKWRNHFVPAFYLKRWVEADDRLSMHKWDGDELVTVRPLPKETGYGDGLYWLENVPDDQVDRLETEFFEKVIDTPGSTAVTKLIERGANGLDHLERAAWCRFLIAMRLRAPDVVEARRLANDDDVALFVDGADQEFHDAFPNSGYPTMRAMLEDQMPRLLDNMGLYRLVRNIVNVRDNNIINNMQWIVRDTTLATNTLLTCDRPFWSMAGIYDPECMIMMPLSPACVFIATSTARLIRVFNSLPKSELVRLVNASIVQNADECVYGRAELKFIANNLKRRVEG